MPGKTIIITILTTLLLAGIYCARKETGEDLASNQVRPDDQEERIIRRPMSRRAETQPPGKGLGRQVQVRGGRMGAGRYQAISLTEDETKILEIKTATPSLRPLRARLQVMGKVLAPQTRMAIVSYAFPARVAGIHVQPGDWVKPGQKIITLQSEEVGSAKSEFYKARADYELAQSNYKREKRLFERGVGAQKNLLTAEAELKVAEVNLNAAEKKLHVLGFTEEHVKEITETHQISPVITLQAPIGGKVIESKVILGAMVDQASELMTIMDPTILWVEAEIFERDIARIKPGQKVMISVPAYPGESFSGKTSYIGDTLKKETRTITVRTEVENRTFKLKPGMFARMEIYLNDRTQALVLPEKAVLEDFDQKIVFVKSEDTFTPRIVQTGIREGGYLEIVSGLEENEEVVVEGSYLLKSKLYDEILKKTGFH